MTDEYDDNINAQLDMAVESADDIGDFSNDAEGSDETTEATTAPETPDTG